MKKVFVLVASSLLVCSFTMHARTLKQTLQKQNIQSADALARGKKPYTLKDWKTKRLTVKDGKKTTTVTSKIGQNAEVLKRKAEKSKYLRDKHGPFGNWKKQKLQPIRPSL